jgi:hypothetical protein
MDHGCPKEQRQQKPVKVPKVVHDRMIVHEVEDKAKTKPIPAESGGRYFYPKTRVRYRSHESPTGKWSGNDGNAGLLTGGKDIPQERVEAIPDVPEETEPDKARLGRFT